MPPPKVYLPMLPSRWDNSIKEWVPSIDVAPARAYGEVEVLLPPDAGRLAAAQCTSALRERLSGASERDYLVCIGDPVLMALAAIVFATRTGGRIQLLKWDRRLNDYLAISARV